jgi:putative drug exporter of the RND superfamily
VRAKRTVWYVSQDARLFRVAVTRLAVAAIRRPVLALAIWVAVVAALAVEGLGFQDRIAPSSVNVPGSRSSEAQQVASRYFGTQASIPVLLEGPQPELTAQGKALTRELRRDEKVTVLSPWDRQAQAIPELRPAKDAVLLLVLARTESTFAGDVGGEVRTITDRVTRDPVRASVTGFSTVGGDLKDASLGAAKDAERLAIPVLLVVLLLVFRSPIAALIPAIFGLAAVEAGFGAMSLIARVTEITDVATALVSMMGLALGVDYSLLMVSRFREELARGLTPRDAAEASVARAGRTVLFAGITLIVAMAVAMALSPGDYLFSSAVSVGTVALLSVAGAYLAVPAALTMLGPRVDKWRIGGAPSEGGRWAGLARLVLRRPVAIGLVALLPLLALALPALGLDTGPPDVRTLPAGSRALVDTQRATKVLGPGWSGPFEVFVVNRTGPVTTEPRLRAIERWQRRVARIPGVETVIGPGAVVRREPELLDADRRLREVSTTLSTSRRDTSRLSRGLGKAKGGVDELRDGLSQASDASAELDAGADRGGDGAARLADALSRAQSGASELRAGLATAASGAGRLAEGSRKAPAGAERLGGALAKAQEGAGRLADGASRLSGGLAQGRADTIPLAGAAREAEGDGERLLQALNAMTVGRADPQYRRALESAGRLSAFVTGKDPRTGAQVDPEYPGLPAALDAAGSQLGEAADGASRLASGGRRLQKGLGRLEGGTDKLGEGLARLATGTERLEAGLTRLDDGSAPLISGLGELESGADRLADGLARLAEGSDQLSGGLASGVRESAPLESGLTRAQRRTRAAAEDTKQASQLGELRDRSPRLLKSGYFVLAALDGSAPTARDQAGLGVNLERGGQAARVTIIPSSGPNDPATRALRERLEREAARLADAADAQVVVGGVAAQISDYESTLGARLPILIIALSIVTLLVLVLILRAPVLALISVLLNLLTVGASFGIVALLFDGSPPLLGGPGYADILALLAMFTIVFGLSLDYQVFILARMREARLRHPVLNDAIVDAIDRTGRVVTGAAAIMGGVFIAFSFADLVIVRQTGIGLATAVLIDATLVRLVLLPAAMAIAGRWTFWIPAWLDRLLPDFDLEGTRAPDRGASA